MELLTLLFQVVRQHILTTGYQRVVLLQLQVVYLQERTQ
jgi:hypothetical protein